MLREHEFSISLRACGVFAALSKVIRGCKAWGMLLYRVWRMVQGGLCAVLRCFNLTGERKICEAVSFPLENITFSDYRVLCTRDRLLVTVTIRYSYDI